MMGLFFYAQTEVCEAEPGKCRGGKVEHTLPAGDAGLPMDRPVK